MTSTPTDKEARIRPFLIALPVIALLLTIWFLRASLPANAQPSIRASIPQPLAAHRQAKPDITDIATSSPTPSTPALVDVALAPTTAFRNSTLVLTYTVFSPVARQVALGAD